MLILAPYIVAHNTKALFTGREYTCIKQIRNPQVKALQVNSTTNMFASLKLWFIEKLQNCFKRHLCYQTDLVMELFRHTDFDKLVANLVYWVQLYRF